MSDNEINHWWDDYYPPDWYLYPDKYPYPENWQEYEDIPEYPIELIKQNKQLKIENYSNNNNNTVQSDVWLFIFTLFILFMIWIVFTYPICY